MMRYAWLLAGVMLSAPAVAEPLLIQAEGQVLMPLCTGRDVQIEGNHNVIKPFGICRSLLLKGVANQVDLALEPGGAIRIEGGANAVTYQAASAAVADMLGDGNTVTPHLVPAVDQGPNLRLSGDDRAQAIDCAGRNVTIQGDRGLYVLRGGCRSLTVQGALVTVQAQMLPGAPIVIDGHGIRVGWALDGRGHAPVSTLHGLANHVERLDAIGGLPSR